MNRVFTKEFFHAVLIRMIRTFAQSAIAYIGTGAVVLNDVNWIGVLSAGAMGAALSFLMALSGLPEVPQEPQEVEYIYPDEEDEDEGE